MKLLRFASFPDLSGRLSRRGRASPWQLQALEPRTHLSTYLVSSSADSGAGTLRQAILDANANSGADIIEFAIGSGAARIAPTTELPDITDALTIDATTQPGFSGSPLVELSGSAIGEVAYGLLLSASTMVRGLVIDSFPAYGIQIDADGCIIQGNVIGLDPAGNPAGNGIGVVITQGAGSIIGGSGAGAGNVISANTQGLVVSGGSGAVIRGNLIGLDPTGTAARANTSGALLVAAPDTTVGGTGAGQGNVISGNSVAGILVGSANASGVVIQGNFIGTDVSGNLAIGNDSDGIEVLGVSGVTIGGSSAGAGNIISGNSGGGILLSLATGTGSVVQGNLIGVAKNGAPLGNSLGGIRIISSTAAQIISNTIANNAGPGVLVLDTDGTTTGNTISRNSIYGNTGLGIDLGGTGVTANDAGDDDTGPNDLQNFPVIVSAQLDGVGHIVVSGTFHGAANQDLTLEAFSNSSIDASGYGEGETYLGNQAITTDAAGDATFEFELFDVPVGEGDALTLTATDTLGNTSEFSRAAALSGTPVPQLDVTPVGILGEADTQLSDVVLATFTDPGATSEPVIDYTATIHWGDGSDSTANITIGDGVFEVRGTHTYAADGTYDVTVDITTSDQRTASIATTAQIGAVQAIGVDVVDLAPSAHVTLSNVKVAQITDAKPGTVPSDYTALIDWGDESEPSVGIVRLDGGGHLVVLGSHTYTNAGVVLIEVTVTHTDGRSAQGAAEASVTAPGFVAQGIGMVGVEGLSAPAVRLATFTDPQAGKHVRYRARVDWGDGRTSNGTIFRRPDGLFTIRGRHVYRLAGEYAVRVTLISTDRRRVEISTNAQVVNAVRLATPVALAVRGRRAAGPVMEFSDLNPFARTGDYSAIIDWGDETSSQVKVRRRGQRFVIVGAHAFAQAGQYLVSVHVTDSAGESFASTQHVRIRSAPSAA